MGRRQRNLIVDVDDCPDFFAVQISGVYPGSGPLTDGNIVIHR